MRYKQKEGPLSASLQLQGKQCIGLHKLSHEFYINGCAFPLTPINTFCMTNSAEYRAFVMARLSNGEQVASSVASALRRAVPGITNNSL
jgi:hypothetical protein